MVARSEINVKLTLTGLQEFQKGLKQVSSSAKKFGQSLKKVGSDARLVARNLAIVGGVAAVAIGKAVQASKEFEDGFTTVVTLLDQASFKTKTFDEGVADLRKGVIDLAKETGQSFEALNQALFDLISAGVEAEESITVLKDAADLATAGATSVDAAVKALTATVTSFGKEAGTTREIAEKFFTAQKFGVTTVEELGEEFNKVGGLANTLGLSFGETLAAAAALTANGAKPTTVAMTELRGVLTAVIAVQKKLPEQSEEIQKALSLENIKRVGLIAAIQETDVALDGNVIAMQELFGNVRALSAVLSLTGTQADLFATIMEAMGDKTGAAATFTDALLVKQETLAFQQERLGKSIEAVGISIGDALTPAIILLTELFSTLIDELGPSIEVFFKDVGADLLIFVESIKADLPAVVEEIKKTATGILAALEGMSGAFTIIGGLLTAFINLMGIIAALIPGVSKETLAFTVIFLQLIGGFRLIGSLITATIAAFGVLEAVLIATGIVSNTFRATFLLAMKNIGLAAIVASKKAIASLIATGASMTSLSGIMAFATGVARGFWIALTGPIGVAVAIAAAIAAIVVKLVGFENIVNAIKAAWDKVISVLKRVVNFIFKIFGGADGKEITVNVNQKTTTETEDIRTTRFTTGGMVRGPGTGTSDSIPAMLSANEFVMKAKAVKKFGSNFMHMINRGILPGFADGGLVPAVAGRFTPIPSAVVAGAGPNRALRPVNLTIPGIGTFPFFDESSSAENLQRSLRRSNLNKSAKLPNWYK